MGVSILWVMLFHAHSRIVSNPLLAFIQDVGFGGVDIFYFLSGLGIYYAYKGDIKDFYKRRLKRILPYYLPLVIAYSLYMYSINYISGVTVFTNIFLLSFWLNLPGTFDWYIPSLLFLYFISPLLLHFFKKNRTLLTIIILLFTSIVYFLCVDTVVNHLLIVFLRLPVFFGGMWLGYCIKEKGGLEIKGVGVVLLLISLVIGVGSLFYFYNASPVFWNSFSQTMLPFWFIVLPYCVFISYFFAKVKVSFISRVFEFFGTYSLLLYIVHVKVIEISLFYLDKYVDFFAFSVTLVSVVIWQRGIDKLLRN